MLLFLYGIKTTIFFYICDGNLLSFLYNLTWIERVNQILIYLLKTHAICVYFMLAWHAVALSVSISDTF